MEYYGSVVDFFGRVGFMEEVKEIMNYMLMELNEYVWGVFLNVIRFYKNFKIVEEVVFYIVSFNLEVIGNYMLMFNIYVVSGRWDDFVRVRLLIRIKGFRKIFGLIWIEVKKIVFIFFVGRVLVNLKELYDVFDDLGRRVEIEGYVFDKSFVL